MPLPTYLPCIEPTAQPSQEKLVTAYHGQECTNQEILSFLFLHHEITISISTLKRLLKKLGLKRRFPSGAENRNEIKQVLQSELQGSTSFMGYRKVWHVMKQKGIPVRRNTVMELVREINPEGVTNRKKRKLRRIIYDVPGPDFLWHLDGYDKLKPFGFSIHGCIDGYSRRLLWLEVVSTNKQPEVIANFYLNCVKQMKGLPTRIRSDDGTEISIIEPLHIALRSSHNDEFCGEASFCVGTSSANQKIESYWLQLTKERPMWWRQFFSELSNYGFLDGSNILVTEAIRYCFMHLIRTNLEDVAIRWNQHLLAPSKNSVLPKGRPDSLYFLPELNNTKSYKKEIDYELFQEFKNPTFAYSCQDNDPAFVEFPETVLHMENHNVKPRDASDALKAYFILLYFTLTGIINENILFNDDFIKNNFQLT